ncbi:MAG: HAMP domain-containing protein, partial [Halorhabdus sp.]
MNTTQSAGVAERILVAFGAVAMRVEPYFPAVVRRNFGGRLLAIAVLGLVVSPVAFGLLAAEPLVATLATSAVVVATGFVAYCEMYWAIIRLDAEIGKVDDGNYDVAFDVDRVDEIGRTFDGLEATADSLAATISARETAEGAQAEAEAAQNDAEAARREAEALAERLERRAAEFSAVMDAAADGDLSRRMDESVENDAMADIAASFNEMVDDLSATVVRIREFAATVDESATDITGATDEVSDASATVSDSVGTIADNAEDQHDHIQRAADELTDLSASVEEI